VYFPGAPFLAAAVLLVLGAGLLTREKARDAG